MSYFIIAIVFLANYLIWKYPLNDQLQKVFRLQAVCRVLFVIVISLWLPYTVSLLIVLDYFHFPMTAFNSSIILCISILSISMFTNLKKE
jgi:hypothetical protein